MKKLNNKIFSLILAMALAFAPAAAYAEPVVAPEDGVEVLAESEAIETEVAETEVVETEVVETEVVETEVVETEVVETEAAESETVETETAETEDVTLQTTGLTSAGLDLIDSDVDMGLYTFTARDVVDENGVGAQKVTLYAYNQADGASAKVGYTAIAAGTDWTATIDLSKHSYKAGTYEVYASAKDASGVTKKIAINSFTASEPKVNIVDVKLNSTQTKATISLKNAKVASNAKKVTATVWGESKGNSDKCVYEFEKVDDKTYKCVVNITAHKEAGSYTVYVDQKTSSTTRLAEGHFTVDSASGRIVVTSRDEVNGYYNVKLKDLVAPATVQKVIFKVWSAQDGKDDIHSYVAKMKNGYWTAKVDLTYHNAEGGMYRIAAYVLDSRGIYEKADGTSKTFAVPTAVPTVKATVNETTGKVKVVVKNLIGADPTTVQALVWGEKDGKNDLHKYTLKTTNRRTYTYTVNLVNHLEKGTFDVRVYAKIGGTSKCRTTTTFKTSFVAANLVTFKKLNANNGNFRISILNPTGLSNLKQVNVAVWSIQNGQDDVKWYPMKKDNNNIWKADIPTSDHYYDRGEYACHIYAMNSNGNKCIARKTYDVQFDGKIGFVKEGTKTYYYQTLGVKASGLIKIKNHYYYFDPKKNNAMTVGWAYISGYKYYFDKNGQMLQDMFNTLGIQSNYTLKINKARNCATLYAWDAQSQSYCIPVKAYRVSTGDDTPIGTFTLGPSHRWMPMYNGTWGQFTIQVSGPYFIHSVTFESMDNHTLLTIGYNMLGINKSAGCIRFRTGDAYVLWQLKNAGKLNSCTIYNAASVGPFEWPYYPSIPENQRWDPTDPAL